jgi:nucleolar pre-ribosomal-associated protein 1
MSTILSTTSDVSHEYLFDSIPTEWLFFNASEEQLLDPDYRRCFIADLFTSNKEKHRSCAALIGHIEHRFDTTDTLIIRGLLSLLAVLFSEARSVFDNAEMVSSKELLFVRSSAFKRLAMDSDVRERVYTGFHELLQSSFDPSSSTDRRILSEISAHWLALLQTQLSQQDDCVSGFQRFNSLGFDCDVFLVEFRCSLDKISSSGSAPQPL